MAALFNLARMTVSSSGPGDITLNSAVSGYLTFDLAGCSTAATGQLLSYAINDITASEIGTATYYSSALALRARTPNRSTNGNAVIAMSNAAQVFITPRAEDLYPLTGGATSTQFTPTRVIYTDANNKLAGDAQLTWTSTSATLTVTNAVAATTPLVAPIHTTGGIGAALNLAVGPSAVVVNYTKLAEFRTTHAINQDDEVFLGSDAGGGLGKYGICFNYQIDGAGLPTQYVGSYTTNVRTNALQLTNTNAKVVPTTASTTPTTGALLVAGGMGVAGAINVGNTGGGVSTFTRNAAPFGAAVATIQVGYEGGVTSEGITFRPQSDGSFPAVFYNAAGGNVGNINTNATDTFYNTASDGRLKTDPQTFDGAALIAALKPYDFAWKSNGARGHGVFAEEAMAVYPGAVTYDQKNDAYGVDYSKFVPLLIRALQQANDRIAALEAKGKP